MIETDKRPAGLEDAQWNEYKTKWLAQLYQSMGVGALMTRNPADAKVKLDKSVAINPSRPDYLCLPREHFARRIHHVSTTGEGHASGQGTG